MRKNNKDYYQLNADRKQRQKSGGFSGFLKFTVSFTAIMLIMLFIILSRLGNGTKIVNPNSQKKNQISTVKGIAHFQNEYLSFDVVGDWIEVADERANGKYYRYIAKNSDGLVVNSLEIYVNRSSLNRTIHVVPVTVSDYGRLTAGEMSDHCNLNYEGLKYGLDPRKTIAESVEVLCWTDNNQQIATAGLIGGDTNISLMRRNNTVATYTIVHTDNTFSQSSNVFRKMLETFKAR